MPLPPAAARAEAAQVLRGEAQVKRLLALAAVVPLTLACSDHDAKSDLPVDNQKLDTTDMAVAVMADGFPNVGHKCVTYAAGPPVGMYTTTDRTVILIYNDHACEGSSQEQDMVVINAVPRSVVNSG